MRNLITVARNLAGTCRTNEEGQTVIEYALVVALVSIVLAAALVGFGDSIIDAAQDAVDGALGGGS
jgi:Flp pilus assembly pilin Flp